MRKALFLAVAVTLAIGQPCAVRAEEEPTVDSERFAALYTYVGNDLGAYYSPTDTVFRLWAPTATEARVVLYLEGAGGKALGEYPMTRGDQGTWMVSVPGDRKNSYYTYKATVDGKQCEAVDPYAKAVGVNGQRGMVVDLPSTDPEGWAQDRRPPFERPTDAVIYELHVRDLSTSPTSGIDLPGKYLSFTQFGTRSPEGESTGLDHLSELGITHVHLLPVFDFRSIDEQSQAGNRFNWGYDPLNYNAPEGSYATDPFDGNVRITEFKQMVAALHARGIRVVMDVVYNHTGLSGNSNLNLLVPGYYYRMNSAGGFSNGSGCGNETASERAMVRKLIVDSAVYWATEYHVDGFRFDLMGLHDIDTMNELRAALDRVDPSILLYGEGWTGGASPLSSLKAALKANAQQLDPRIALFCDDIRDGAKGSVFVASGRGYVNGHAGHKTDVMFGIAGSVQHPQIEYRKATMSKVPWAAAPSQAVNYVSAHDNNTLWDKLRASQPEADEAELVRMNKLAAAIVFTAQGIPFFQAGEEFARSKNGDSNSYQSPDSVNQLNWSNKAAYRDLFAYYQGLIALRKAHPAFRLNTAEAVRESLFFLDTEPQILAYTLSDHAGDDSSATIAVVLNVGKEAREVTLPSSGWRIVADGQHAGVEALSVLTGDRLLAEPQTAYVLLSDK